MTTGRDRLDGESVAELPDREALTLISTEPVLPIASADELAGATPADATSTASDTADGASDLVSADASATESDAEPTSEDQTRTFTNSDTASAST